jgi:hypothetical protein
MLLVTRRLAGRFGLVGALVAAATMVMAVFVTSAEAHHGDFYASADCYTWEVGATYVGDSDRRVDVDVTVNGEHIVISDTGYQTGDTLFERSGTGSVDAEGTVKVYFKRHDTWRLEAKDKLDFHFDWSECEETPPPPQPSPPAPPPPPQPSPQPSPESTAQIPPAPPSGSPPQAGSEVRGVVLGPRAFPNSGDGSDSGGSGEPPLLIAGLALLAGAGTIALATARARRGR